MPTVIVVGAGLAGLTAAFRLQQGGADVTVLEAGPGPGGRTQTKEHDGYIVDTGPDAFTDSYTCLMALFKDLGLEDQLVDSSGVIGLIRDGRLIDVDPSKPLQLLRTPILSLPAKVRLFVGVAKLRRAIRDVDAYELEASAHLDDPEVPAYDFAVRHFGKEVADYLIDPVIRLATGGGSRRSSSLNVITALSVWSAPVRNVRGGLATLPRVLSKQLSVRYGTKATGVDESSDGVAVSYSDRDGVHTLTADHCVIGAMFDTGMQIWPALKEIAQDFADHLQYVKLISVSLGYRRTTRSQAYIVQVPTVEHPEALLIFLEHNKAPDRVPDGHALVTIYTDTAVTDEFLERSDAEIEEWAAGVIEKICPELAGQRDFCSISRWPLAAYEPVRGHWRRSADLMNSIPTTGRVQLAGDIVGGSSLESAVRSGEKAARRILGRH